MAETDTATAIAPSVSTAVTFAVSPVSEESDSAGQAFSGVFGYWTPDPLTLSGSAVTGSKVLWDANIPDGTTLAIETSINNGLSWEPATSGQPIPRLREGDTVTRTVLARVTFTRPSQSDESPKLISFEWDVSVDASVDELIPVGHGMIDKVTVTAVGGTTGANSSSGAPGSNAVISRGGGQSGGGTSIKVHVTDLSRAFKRNVWQQPFTLPSGLTYDAAIKAMCLDRLPSQTDFSLSSSSRLTQLLIFGMDQGGDPWQDMMDLAAAVGYECFFDAKGTFVFRPVPDPRIGEPVFEFDQTADPKIVEASRELSDEQTFNDIVVIGQSTSSANPYSAEAFDDDPSSPTYILGPYGRVSQRLTFSTITTQDQAQAAADAALYNSIGMADTVTITLVPFAPLEPGDVLRINVPNVNVNGTYVINSMTTPLSPAEPQQLVCFRQSVNN